MKNKRRLIYLAVAILSAGGVVCLVLPTAPREPVYQGRRLSEWMNEIITIFDTNAPARTAATNAVKEAGIKAIPTLLRLTRAHDSSLKSNLFALAERQHFIKIEHPRPEALNAEAEHGFRILGPAAASAAPELLRIYDRKFSASSQYAAAYGLLYIGPEAKAAVPSLLRETANTNSRVRDSAIRALGGIHADPTTVVPVLIKGLQDPDLLVRSHAAWGLGNFGPEAKAAVPDLVNLISKERGSALGGGILFPDQEIGWADLDVWKNALEALKKIDPASASFWEAKGQWKTVRELSEEGKLPP